MADYFTNVSMELALPSKEAVDYAIELAQAMADIDTEGTKAEIVPAGWEDTEDENWNFDIEKESDSSIWIHSDNGCIDEIIKLIQHLMQKYGLTEPVTFEWSYDCSKARTDAYGGGAAYITATEVRTFNTSQWLRAQGIGG
jgi:hypothetical protein